MTLPYEHHYFRVFLMGAAPGEKLPEWPLPTHTCGLSYLAPSRGMHNIVYTSFGRRTVSQCDNTLVKVFVYLVVLFLFKPKKFGLHHSRSVSNCHKKQYWPFLGPSSELCYENQGQLLLSCETSLNAVFSVQTADVAERR